MIMECKESILVLCKRRSDLFAMETSTVAVRCKLGLALKPGVRRQQADCGS